MATKQLFTNDRILEMATAAQIGTYVLDNESYTTEVLLEFASAVASELDQVSDVSCISLSRFEEMAVSVGAYKPYETGDDAGEIDVPAMLLSSSTALFFARLGSLIACDVVAGEAHR